MSTTKKPRSARNNAAIFVAPLAVLATAGAAGDASAQTAGAGAPPPSAAPAAAPTTTVVQTPYGQQGAAFNPDAHLGRGSQSTVDINKSGNGFDLNRIENQSTNVRGGEGGQFVVDGSNVPQAHTVRRGDTLWAISGQYYRSSYSWPQVWSRNPQILNPHWIYPGDRIRLRDESKPLRGGVHAPKTVFLRDIGWIDDPEKDAWGELVGAPGEHMMLADDQEAYVQMDEGRDVKIGDRLTIFRPLKTARKKGEAKGEVVSVRGTVRVDRYNKNTGMAKVTIIESLDVVERGNLIGPVQRQFLTVPPVASDKNLEVSIIASLYPHEVFGDAQILFIDKGKAEGVYPGMRFFALERKDKWVESLKTTTEFGRVRARTDIDEMAEVDKIPTGGPEEDYPDETYAELRVLTVREHTAACIVVAAKHEIERDAYLVARKGF
jgi:hypothetical protein